MYKPTRANMWRMILTFSLAATALGCRPLPQVAPPARLEPAPSPNPSREEVPFVERLPIQEGVARREALEREEAREETVVVPIEPDECKAVSSEERGSCPLQTQGKVLAIEDIPGGVRIRYQMNTVHLETMRRIVGCQMALARGAGVRGFCPFLDPSVSVDVSETRGGVWVDLTDPQEVEVGVFRRQVRLGLDARD